MLSRQTGYNANNGGKIALMPTSEYNQKKVMELLAKAGAK
jgi:hypothetical protein